jgi:hypothetical protein
MRIGVIANLVTALENLARDGGIPLHVPAHHEECGADAVPIKDVEHLSRVLRVWAVIEGQCHDQFAHVHPRDIVAKQLKRRRVDKLAQEDSAQTCPQGEHCHAPNVHRAGIVVRAVLAAPEAPCTMDDLK